MTPRRVLVGWFAAIIAVHAVLSAWQPLHGDDWSRLLSAGQPGGAWLATHYAVSDMLTYAFSFSTAAYVAISALGTAALVLGTFALGMRRLPRPTWDDTFGVIALTAMLWLGQPRPGLTWFYRPHVATNVIGCVAAVWIFVPLRCGWRIRGLGAAALVVAGYVAGTATRQIAIASLVGMAIALYKRPDARRGVGAWLALAGLAIGSVAGYLFQPPQVERVIKRGFEFNAGQLTMPVRNAGLLVTILLLFALARLAIAAWRPGAIPAPDAAADDALPPPRETRAWLYAWFGICVVALIGPGYNEATIWPATIALVAGAIPYIAWMCQSRGLRGTVVVAAVLFQAAMWATGLSTMGLLHDEYEARLAKIHATAPGETAVIKPFPQDWQYEWFLGEDWGAASRQLNAIELFGIRDIDFEYRFFGYEINAKLGLHLEVQGLDPAMRAAVEPKFWATDLIIARHQFERFQQRAIARAGKDFTARLVVDDPRLVFPERRGRPLEIVSFDHGRTLSTDSSHLSLLDVNNRQRISIPPRVVAAFPEAYLVHDGVATHQEYAERAYHVTIVDGGFYAVVACNASLCMLVDAFVPRF